MDEEIEQPGIDEGSGRSSLAARGCGYLGCLLLIGLVVVVVAGAFFAGRALEPLADRYLWTPADVVREYLTAFADGDKSRAQSFLCASVAKGQPLDPGGPLGVTDPSAYVDDKFPYPRDNGQLAIYYAVSVPGYSQPKRAQALLVREDPGWRICSFSR